MGSRWTVTHSAQRLVLARAGARQMDVCAEASFPMLRREALAHEIRKDLWRELQTLRGFSPIVMVEWTAGGLHVVAGGQMDTPFWPREKTLTAIETLLSNPAKRARWIAHARLK